MKITHFITALSLSITAVLATTAPLPFTEPTGFFTPAGIPGGFTVEFTKAPAFFNAIQEYTTGQKAFQILEKNRSSPVYQQMLQFIAVRVAGELWFEGDMVESDYITPTLPLTAEQRTIVLDSAQKTGFLKIVKSREEYEAYAHVPAVMTGKTTLVLATGDLMMPGWSQDPIWNRLDHIIPSGSFTRQWNASCVTVCNAPAFMPGIVADINNRRFIDQIPETSLKSIILDHGACGNFLGIQEVFSTERDPTTDCYPSHWAIDTIDPIFQAYASKLQSGGIIQVVDGQFVGDNRLVYNGIVVYTKP